MKKYEYTHRHFEDYVVHGADLLKEMGEDGWLLCAVDETDKIFFFAREIGG